jgi:hypothetical protein
MASGQPAGQDNQVQHASAQAREQAGGGTAQPRGNPACQGPVTRERDAHGYTFAINVRCDAPFGAWRIWRRLRALPGVRLVRGPSLLRWRARFEYLGKSYQAVALPGHLWIGSLAPADLYRETDTLYDVLREALHGLD